ncbi:hypothetical protein KAFR_0G03250 [Kazachstania africana CBS 2517]|uniref:Uncharacterized protein n=1 Tax=Kazachstania africana (strain ATCC 22294 / BCRC 22015 / CBS 2517 / CECT 1963 / NBRC 1671 / NRRL Y-8276) TaxID=1071382 RepID=H2AYA7_KAZAF|nr:hypothetical protein KAFR_0G03250 [Kazachstania africana CBS 2517]CCF59357.1 hypothetical protein KAFR_0G03250 [Kazachstania africana CBS 2517]
MSKEEEEYDDLDDLLNEDPSQFDQEPNTNGDDAVKNLENSFNNLMSQDTTKGDSGETVKNLQSLLHYLGGEAKSDHINEPGFNNVISSTLDRLKKNGGKIDASLNNEESNSDDMLSNLFSQMLDGNLGDDENMDSAILTILNQMSSKEVLYQPMKEMQTDFIEWFERNEGKDEYKDSMPVYKKQFDLVEQLVHIYEIDDYNNETYRDQITELLDNLEQLGDSPVSKGFNNSGTNSDGIDELTKILGSNGNDKEGLPDLDKELEDTCKQQ